jgi:hypothetical protein
MISSKPMVPETSGREAITAPEGFDPDVHAAVTDMYTYVLLLEAEGRRVDNRLQEAMTTPGSSHERAQLVKLRAELAAELDALRKAATALHQHGVGPVGRR